MRFTAVVCILILLETSTAQVATCQDDGGVFCIQTPEFIGQQNYKISTWTASARAINQAAGHSISTTMTNFIVDHMNIKVLAYSDDPPNLPPQNEKSKAKGVLLVHSGADDDAAWFVHTVPKFLAHLGVYSWPAAETPKGHMFLCLSLSKAHLNSVAKVVRYQEPFIYANNLSPALLTQYNELSNLATGVEIRVTPFLEHAKFTTKAVQVAANIEAFGKHTKSYLVFTAVIFILISLKSCTAQVSTCKHDVLAYSNDPPNLSLRNEESRTKAAILNQYTELSNLVNGVDVRITLFLEQAKFMTKADTRSKSICNPQYQLRKIVSPMQLDGSQVSRQADSAKWALIDRKNTVCFTTNDYKMSEKQIPGAAICLENIGVYNAFIAAAFNVEACFFNSGATIDSDAGHSIRRTITDFVANNGNINVLAYSDDPPNLPPMNEKSKAKGVLLVDNRANDAAAWFVHTVPNFLAHLGGYSWPIEETAKGHMFLCLSLNEAHLNSVAKAIRYQEPYVYANNMPAAILSQHIELSNLATGVEIRVTPFLEHAKFTTKAAANIEAFGKHTKSFADIYAKVLKNKLSASIRIWAPSDVRSKSICKGKYQLRKVASPMQLAGGQVRREVDSARWAVVDGKNIVCLTTNDYKINEKQIPGAAVCLENAGVLLVHNAADEAAWFVHTVPNFLAYLNAYSWPAAETAKGHMFLCVSFNKAHLNSVGKAIRYQEPYIYVNNLSAEILNQHMELSNLINGIDVRVTPFLAHETFVTKGEQAVANIQAFGKHSKSFADMYARILRNKFAASIMVWSPADARSKSICRGQHKLQKITSIQLDGVQVSRGADSAKWALIDGKNTATDKRTPGAAVCLKNAGVYNAFRTAAFNNK
ncbi:Plancitoxin-1 [Trichinella patagoniensis]|uniref:Plancitoxin-1 n=1 Tax=Trichinella patagoniensis TaxID=990121 RepID=A0A0V1A616_9BILA|nr:Plancitoxin-1 [Trichinella patagoniensis]